ncbi:MAG: V-type ATP synthase subunit D [Oscillospiraceae bacterium]|nr:V-type ATP synthase subunit D [Oscillospiraceae bacterium]
MDMSYLPTYSNLMKARNTLKLSQKGHELLDRKKNILVSEMLKYVEQARQLKEKIDTAFSEAYAMLQDANIDLGIENIMRIADSSIEDDGISILFKTLMGVEIPVVKYSPPNKVVDYSFYDTTFSVDKAVLAFIYLKKIIIELAQIDNTIYKLSQAILKTQKRSNALKNIVIPRTKKLELKIQGAIEEREREDFSRLKVIKKGKIYTK